MMCVGEPATSAAAASPVDALIEAWMQVVGQVKQASMPDHMGLSRVQVAVLMALSKRSPRRITSLAQDLGIELSVLSRQVAGLVEDGLATRERDPDDGRAWLVRLTDQGRSRIVGVHDQHRTYFAGLIATFPDEQIEAATAIMRGIAAHFQECNRSTNKDQLK